MREWDRESTRQTIRTCVPVNIKGAVVRIALIATFALQPSRSLAIHGGLNKGGLPLLEFNRETTQALPGIMRSAWDVPALYAAAGGGVWNVH